MQFKKNEEELEKAVEDKTETDDATTTAAEIVDDQTNE